jgi:hypothetical protein
MDHYVHHPRHTVPSAVSRTFRMSRDALADGDTMFDVITYMYQVVCKSSERTNCILHASCHPGLHFRSLEHEVSR